MAMVRGLWQEATQALTGYSGWMGPNPAHGGRLRQRNDQPLSHPVAQPFQVGGKGMMGTPSLAQGREGNFAMAVGWVRCEEDKDCFLLREVTHHQCVAITNATVTSLREASLPILSSHPAQSTWKRCRLLPEVQRRQRVCAGACRSTTWSYQCSLLKPSLMLGRGWPKDWL